MLPTLALQKRTNRLHNTGKYLRKMLGKVEGIFPGIAVFSVAFLAFFTRLYYLPCALGTSFACAVCQQKKHVLSCFLGTASSLCLRLIWHVDAQPMLYAPVLTALAVCVLFKKHKDMPCGLTSFFLLLPRCGYEMITKSAAQGLLGLLAAFAAWAAAPAILQGLCLPEKQDRPMNIDDKLCFVLLVFLLVNGGGTLNFATINIGQALAVALTLAASCGGMTQGALAGLLLGSFIALGGGSYALAVYLAIGGLAAGAAYGKRRKLIAALLFPAGVCFTLTITRAFSPELTYQAMALGLLLFLLPYENGFSAWIALMQAPVRSRRGMENVSTAYHMEQWKETLFRLADQQPLPVQEKIDAAEEMMCLLCQTCPENEKCASEEVSARFKNALEAMAQGELDSYMNTLRGCGCIRLHMYPDACREVQTHAEESNIKYKRAMYESAMTKTLLQSAAETGERIYSHAGGDTPEDLLLAAQIEKILENDSLNVHLLSARREQNREELLFRVSGVGLGVYRAEKLLNTLRAGGHDMEVLEAEKSRLMLESLPEYTLLTGTASVSASGDENMPCGDSTRYLRISGQTAVFALSDGMGQGEEASRDSEKTLDLLMLCLKAGYTIRQAVTAVNGMMITFTMGSRFATADLVRVQLSTGACISMKLGSTLSLLIHEGHVRTLEGTSLPLGMMEEVQPTLQSFHLAENDILLLFSDGITDLYPETEQLIAMAETKIFDTPQRTADAILRAAILRSQDAPKDDMTCVCLKLVKSR